jgi:myo-inositol-1(or 4)-monophosphatase
MTRAAYKAARRLVRDFGEVEKLQVSRKGPGDFVSNADRQAEKTLYEELSKARPGYSFLMEESGKIAGDDPDNRWIVDPLDGTTNFLHGIPHFAISIGLERKGQLIAGVVYDPIQDEMFAAEKGVGAFLNNTRIRVSSRRDLGDALVATGFKLRNCKTADSAKDALQGIMRVGPHVSNIRNQGATSLDLAYVAAGRFDGAWLNHFRLWDIAAAIVIIREAGGIATDLKGAAISSADCAEIIAGNEYIQTQLRKLIS